MAVKEVLFAAYLQTIVLISSFRPGDKDTGACWVEVVATPLPASPLRSAGIEFAVVGTVVAIDRTMPTQERGKGLESLQGFKVIARKYFDPFQ